MSETDDVHDVGPVVYELWSDEDLRWIEIPCPTLELSQFLESWCDKNRSIFRRRPFRKPAPRHDDPLYPSLRDPLHDPAA